jgi:hypothetical protein
MKLSLHATALVLSAIGGAHAAAPQTPEQWRAALQRDIEAGYQLTLENHPGVHDAQNPDFLKHLNAARDGALALSGKVQDAAGYAAAIQRFTVLVHDGHAGLFWKVDSYLKPERWPGFVAVWRGDGMYVYASQPGGPARGAQILSCDGKSAEQLMRENLFSFMGRIDEPGQWWSMSRWLFTDRHNPFIQLPQRCDFLSEGRRSTLQLAWQERNEQYTQWRNDAYNGDRLPVGLTEPRPKLFWAAMPSFAPNAEEREAYAAMNREVAARRDRLLEADAVVIDLRHNQGGSSTWSRNFAGALWGEGRVERRMNSYFAKTETWYRASPGNTAYFGELAERMAAEKQPDTEAWARAIHKNMQAALAKGEKFWIKRDEDDGKPVPNPEAEVAGDPAAFTKPVYVIVPGQCASACLDALDVFTRFPNTKLIGAPSSADSTYMEVRYAMLESGLAGAIIPNKVYVGRPRGNGVVYTPALVVKDVDWSTSTFLKAVERDLAGK